MENTTLKDRYLKLLTKNNGLLDEIELGEKLGLDEDSTQKILSELLAENRIDYKSEGTCNYQIKKRIKH